LHIIDISLPISPAAVVWPGQPSVAVQPVHHLDQGARSTVSQITMSVHTGTHVDAPCHFLAGGAGVDRLDLNVLIGPAVVVHAPQADALTPAVLEALAIPAGTERLLIRTRNSERWASGEAAAGFIEDYVGVDLAGARWLIERGVRLLGADYFSAAALSEIVETHRTLLAAHMVLLEGLNLSQAAPGSYQLVCLPLDITGCDGAPTRAVLIADRD